MTNIHSLHPMSAFYLYVSLYLSPLFVRPSCLSVANNHTLSPHLASVVEDARVICLHKTHTLFLYFYRVLSMSLTHAHTLFSVTLSISHTLSLVRYSLTSTSIWMFWKVKPRKSLTRYMWRKTFTSGMIIRFITTCTYFILSFLFGIVDISNFFINLVKVQKFDLKKCWNYIIKRRE